MGATYTLASAYVGKTIKVKVTFTDDADNEETLTSPATAEVAAGVPTDPPAKPRNLTGTANWDGTVTLRWDAPDDDSVMGYQILRRRPTEGERTLLVHVNDTGSYSAMDRGGRTTSSSFVRESIEALARISVLST